VLLVVLAAHLRPQGLTAEAEVAVVVSTQRLPLRLARQVARAQKIASLWAALRVRAAEAAAAVAPIIPGLPQGEGATAVCTAAVVVVAAVRLLRATAVMARRASSFSLTPPPQGLLFL
jgi:hypothetical protein